MPDYSVNLLKEIRPFLVPLQIASLVLWRTRGLNRVFNAVVPHAPAPVRDWLERQRAQARAADLRARIHRRSRLVPESELRALLRRGLQTLIERHGAASLGSYLEFGVYNGTSFLCMHNELKALGLDHVRLFGFDSFQGLPSSAATEDNGRWEPGRCYSPLEFTTAVLEAEGIDWQRATLVPGWFRDTLTAVMRDRLGLQKASVIMIDCDLYSSAKEALDFCGPLIGDEALILFDEFHPRGLRGQHAGERRAFDEFLHEWPCFSVTPFGQYAPRTETFLLTRTHASGRAMHS